MEECHQSVRVLFANKKYRYTVQGDKYQKKRILKITQGQDIQITAVQKLIIFSVWWYLIEPLFALLVFLGAGIDGETFDAGENPMGEPMLSKTAREVASQRRVELKIGTKNLALWGKTKESPTLCIHIDKKGTVQLSDNLPLETNTHTTINEAAIKRWKNTLPRVVVQGLLLFVGVVLLIGFLA